LLITSTLVQAAPQKLPIWFHYTRNNLEASPVEAHTGVILNIQNLTTPSKSCCCLLSGEKDCQGEYTRTL